MDKVDKETLFKAVSSYGKYTDNQSKVLCYLVNRSVDNMIYPAVKKVSEETGVTRPTVYASLKSLLIDGVIEKCTNSNGVYKINKEKINFIINQYKKENE